MNVAARISFGLIAPIGVLVLSAGRPASATPPGARVAAVWAVHDGEKIDGDDLSSPEKSSNMIWDGKKIGIFGARNEIVAFQVIVESGETGIGKLSASFPRLTDDSGRPKITYAPPAKDPTLYAGRPIELFSVHYMRVDRPSHASWIYAAGGKSLPAKPTGLKPVQLVPENARAGKGGFPVSVPPRRNQSIWIEVYIPKDIPAGRYHGQVTVTADDETRHIPVELRVFNFSLPDKNSMTAMVYYESDQPILYQGKNLDGAYHRLAHRNRIEFVDAYDLPSLKRSLGRFTGADFRPNHGYEGPGQGTGNVVVPASFYGVGDEWEDAGEANRRSDAWMKFLGAHLPRAITFLYVCDEPTPRDEARILRIARNIHSDPGPGRNLPILVTSSYTKRLDGAVDIWVSDAARYDNRTARRERERGRKYWLYNGGRPAVGAIVIESPAVDPRATIWACFKDDIDVYFYWHADHWLHNHFSVVRKTQNVWANPITFDSRGYVPVPRESRGFINGDGVLVYPGEDVLHPEEDRGIDGPCSTVQLANFRRGLQDHQYLTLARRLGLEREIQDALAVTVPKVFSEAGDRVGFSESGDDYERERYRLGVAIENAETKH